MTKSEQNFREIVQNDYHVKIYKIPDFKSAGMGGLVGVPDYLVINKGKMLFFEVKEIKSKFLSLSNFTPAQVAVFTQLTIDHHVDIYVFTLRKNNKYFITLFSDLLRLEKINETSGNVIIPLKEILS